jgi:hypothetical protein
MGTMRILKMPAEKISAGICVYSVAVIVTFIIFASYSISFAQLESLKGIEFNDGSVVYGKILKMNVYEVKVEGMDGKISTYRFDDVRSFIKDGEVEQYKSAPVKEASVIEEKKTTPIKEAAVVERSKDVPKPKIDTTYTAPKPFSVEAGLRYYYFDYKEDFVPPLKSTERGWLPGVYTSFEYKKLDGLYAKLYGSYASADLTYDGSTQTGIPVTYSNSRQRFYKFESRVGYTVKISKNTELIPYVGYGYRLWERGETKPTIPVWIQEDYSWHYFPIGLNLNHEINRRWSIGGLVAANIMFMGKMKTHFSELDSRARDNEVDLGNTIGFSAAVPVKYQFTDKWFLVVTPWYEYSSIGRSNTVDVLYSNGTPTGYNWTEPASTTHQYGFDLGMGYAF